MPAETRYADAELTLFAKLKNYGYSPAVVYDIGGSDGTWSRVVSEVFDKSQFHLFEPLAPYFEGYRATLKRNLADHANFQLHPIALSAETGRSEICITSDGVGSSLIDMGNYDGVKSRVVVESWRLDDYAKASNLALPNMLKMDVQGTELEILKGGTETIRSADVVLIESWFYRGYGQRTALIGELIEYLEPLGFVLTDLGGQYIGNRHQQFTVDAFFMNTRFLDSFKESSGNWNW
jgi:FkbM family methyltransferase